MNDLKAGDGGRWLMDFGPGAVTWKPSPGQACIFKLPALTARACANLRT